MPTIPIQVPRHSSKAEEAQAVSRLALAGLLDAMRDPGCGSSSILDQLKTIFDAVSEGISIVDAQQPDLPLIFVNATFERITGYSFEEACGRNCRFLQSAEADQPGLPALRTALQEGRPVKSLLKNYRKDGSIFWNDLSISPIADSSGRVTHFVGIQNDVTAHIQAEIAFDLTSRQLEESQTMMRSIFENVQDAMVVFDRNRNAVLTNEAAIRLFGLNSTSLSAGAVDNLFELLLPSGEPLKMEMWPNIRAFEGDYVHNFELTVRRRDSGRTMDMEISTAPVLVRGGQPERVVVTCRDTTAKKTLERQLQESQKLEAVGQLTGGIAHDFNNLLGVILGNLDLLERQVSGDEIAMRRLNTAQKAATRGADLTRRLLASTSNDVLRPAPTSLNQCIENLFGVACHVLGPDVRIVLDLDRTIPAVLVDETSLEMALFNLAVNARDAMPLGGAITIATKLNRMTTHDAAVQVGDIQPGLYASVLVTDTGCGMSKEIKARAFEPFFTTKPRGKGTGLGLAMVFGFVKQSGGITSIESRPEHGTTVSFCLALAEQPVAAPSLPHDERRSALRGTVLVVDDEEDLVEIASAYFQELGYTVHHAHDSAAALLKLEQIGDVDFMLTDILMPGGMDGFALAEKVRAAHPSIGIILCSGFSDGSLGERNTSHVMERFLHKPYQRDKFQSVVRDLRHQRQAESALST